MTLRRKATEDGGFAIGRLMDSTNRAVGWRGDPPTGRPPGRRRPLMAASAAPVRTANPLGGPDARSASQRSRRHGGHIKPTRANGPDACRGRGPGRERRSQASG